MNGFTAATLLNFLALAVATSPPNPCWVPTKHPFSPEKFFNGKWWLTNLENSNDLPSICETSKSEIVDGVIKHTFATYKPNENSDAWLTECSSVLKEQLVDGRFDFDCNFTDANGKLHEFKSEYGVIDTDYENFAVAHVCVRLQSPPSKGVTFILSRNSNEPNDSKISEALKALNLDLDTFDARKKYECKEYKYV